MRQGEAALQHILGIEMRALAIRRGHCMQHGQSFRTPLLGHESEGRMQREEIIELDEAGSLIQGQFVAQLVIVLVADRWHRCKAVQRTAQQHEHEAGIARCRRCEADTRGKDAGR
jgi:hypothetical protein